MWVEPIIYALGAVGGDYWLRLFAGRTDWQTYTNINAEREAHRHFHFFATY